MSDTTIAPADLFGSEVRSGHLLVVDPLLITARITGLDGDPYTADRLRSLVLGRHTDAGVLPPMAAVYAITDGPFLAQFCHISGGHVFPPEMPRPMNPANVAGLLAFLGGA